MHFLHLLLQSEIMKKRWVLQEQYILSRLFLSNIHETSFRTSLLCFDLHRKLIQLVGCNLMLGISCLKTKRMKVYENEFPVCECDCHWQWAITHRDILEQGKGFYFTIGLGRNHILFSACLAAPGWLGLFGRHARVHCPIRFDFEVASPSLP